MHRIPGLAERYLSLNDDMLVVSPVPAAQFFGEGGVAMLTGAEHKYTTLQHTVKRLLAGSTAGPEARRWTAERLCAGRRAQAEGDADAPPPPPAAPSAAGGTPYAYTHGVAKRKECVARLVSPKGAYPSHAPRPFLRSAVAAFEAARPELFMTAFATRFRCAKCIHPNVLMLASQELDPCGAVPVERVPAAPRALLGSFLSLIHI